MEYPKSINRRQCIGPCYPRGKIAVHPQSFDLITDTNHNFCPVEEYIYDDETTGDKIIKTTDICHQTTDDTNHEYDFAVPISKLSGEYLIEKC